MKHVVVVEVVAEGVAAVAEEVMEAAEAAAQREEQVSASQTVNALTATAGEA